MTHRPLYCPRCATGLEEQVHGERPRLACPKPGCAYVHWDNPVPVVAAVVEHGDGVILARNRDWPVKFYGLITGFLERDETPEHAVLREVDEELGLHATQTPAFIGHYSFTRMNQLIIAYHVRGEGEVRLGEELVDYRCIPLHKLRPWPMGTGYALRDWLRSRGIDAPMLDLGTGH
jgi:NAD+ diphosphatase